jgi:predicted lipase
LDDIYVIQDKKNDFQGVIGYSHSLASIVVAYRGSVDVMNWIDNLTFYKKNAYKRFPDISVHQGFYWVYKSVASKVLMQVGQLRKKYRNSSLLVTGHSLGGAVAALSAFELQVLHNVTVEAIYTFGEPRVGNSYFSEKMRESFHKLFRLIHFRDVVPHLPPNWIGFMHSAQEVLLDILCSGYCF